MNYVCTSFDKPADVVDRQQKEVDGVFEPLPSEVKAEKDKLDNATINLAANVTAAVEEGMDDLTLGLIIGGSALGLILIIVITWCLCRSSESEV